MDASMWAVSNSVFEMRILIYHMEAGTLRQHVASKHWCHSGVTLHHTVVSPSSTAVPSEGSVQSQGHEGAKAVARSLHLFVAIYF
jgi:hypothetical protein